MTARKLFEAIGEIDDDLVLAADEAAARPLRGWRPMLRRALPLAACLCLIAGGALLILRPGSATGGMAADTTAEAGEPQEASLSAEAAPQTDMTMDSPVDAAPEAKEFSAAANGAGVSAFPAELLDLLAPAADAPRVLDQAPQTEAEETDFVLPETWPVYRTMAAARTIDAEGMRARLETLLTALGLDPALAQDAVYTGLTQAEAEEQAAALRQNGGSQGDELALWADAAAMTLDVAPGDDWPQGLTLSVGCDGTATALVPGATAAARTPASEVLANWPEVAALAGENAQPADSNATDGAALFRENGVLGELRCVQVQLDEAGGLCRVVWRAPDLGEPLAACTALTLAEAKDLLRQNVFLTAGGALDGQTVLDDLAGVELVYPQSRACAWYLPYWRFIADEGPAGQDTGERLYGEYLVPAVSLDELCDLAGLS